MNDTAVELIELVKDFSGKKAVDTVSFKVKTGDIVGLLGPNGAGKTTSIRMMMNIIAPDSGSIEIFRQPINESLLNQIGYLPEERGLYRKMKVMDTLYFFAALKNMPRKQIKIKGEELLKKFDLYSYRQKKVEELSKGMAQKLQIITTILHQPKLLILDEPFSGLDPVNIELVRKLILEYKQEGGTVILSTHLMDYAEKIIDSLVMISNGKKVLDGTLAQIKANIGKNTLHIKFSGDCQFVSNLPYIKEFHNYGNTLEIQLIDLSYKDQFLKDIISKLSLHQFTIQEPSLNQIFIKEVSSKDSQ
jgi:ABC-2 type transport system ATP-binding protein